MGGDYLTRSYWNGLIKMSLTKLFILRALYDEPLHGYALRQRISDLTSGCCTPSEGALYPALHEFERGGYVAQRIGAVGGRERKTYTLTGRGVQALRTGLQAWEDTARALLDAKESTSV